MRPIASRAWRIAASPSRAGTVPPRIEPLRTVPQRYLVGRLKGAVVDFLADGTGRETDQLDDPVAGPVRERVAAAVRDGVLLHPQDEIGRRGPGVRPIVQEPAERMIGGAILAAVVAALIQVQGKRAEHLAADPHASVDGHTAQRDFRRDGDVRRGRRANIEQRREGVARLALK